MSSQAIGIFDSGVGGTSIWKEIQDLLPHENTIYLADSKYAPYGPKGPDRIKALSQKNVAYLQSRGCKLIVVACNTATTNAIEMLRERYTIPFIGIEPAIKPAALQSKTKVIGILATKGTLSSALFHKTTNAFANDTKVMEQNGEGIVQLIETGGLHSEAMRDLLQGYLQPMLDANIDHLVLGCTHYPYLTPMLRELLPERVKIIDSGAAVAKQVQSVLEDLSLLNTTNRMAQHAFYTNGNPEVMQSLIGDAYTVNTLDF